MDAHLRDIRSFVAVAEAELTVAAGLLHVSQPALSKQIRGLERALNARLFTRDRRGVTLTDAGRALLDTAGVVLRTWDAGAGAVAEAASREAKVLRVGTLTSIGRSLYPAIRDRYAERQPDWTIELRSFGWADPTAGLADRQTDAAFLWLPIAGADLACEVLVTEPRVLALSTSHRLATRRSVSMDDLANEPFVALPSSAGPQRDFWLATDERGGSAVRIAAEVTSADETFELVASGAAVHLLASGNADVYARPGVTSIAVEGLTPARLAVACRHDDQRAPVRRFIEACADAAASTGCT